MNKYSVKGIIFAQILNKYSHED